MSANFIDCLIMYLQVENNNKIIQKLKLTGEPIKIGSSAGCDVRLDEDSYHAVITSALNVLIIKDGKYLSDKFATYLNGQKITQSKQLKQGDVITFDASKKVRILVKEDSFFDSFSFSELFTNERLAKSVRYIFPGLLAVLGIALLFSSFSKNEPPPANKDRANLNISTNKSEYFNQNAPNLNSESRQKTPEVTAESNENESLEPQVSTDEANNKFRLKMEIDNFLRKISTNNSKTVKIPDSEALISIEKEIEENSGSERLEDIFNKFNSDSRKSNLLNKIREKNLPAGLVIISSLVDSESENLVKACEQEINKLYPLSITFNVTDSDSSLLVIAAKAEGGGSAKTHPLLKKMKDLLSNSRDERNVWFLASKKGIKDETKKKILKFIAFGLIAQNPRKYQIAADPII